MDTWRVILFPLAWLYGWAIRTRHWLFDNNFLPIAEFKIPIIGVGNLCLGGSGKTPFVEYLVKILGDEYKLATLSRGYGRKTSGFHIVNQFSNYRDVGDEPLQFAKKFGNKVTVAVDKNRKEGITHLMENDKNLDLILLDDALQHRFVKSGLTILLTSFDKLYMEDYLLPVGTLRDTIAVAKQADAIVVTKTHHVLSPITRRRVNEILKPLPHQKVYYSYLSYGDFIALPGFEDISPPKKVNTIVLFTGIANSYPFQEYLRDQCSELIVIDFPDHHVFRKKDLHLVAKTYDDAFSQNKIIVTTEKDSMRLLNSPYLSELNNLPVFYVPIEMKLHGADAINFENQIRKYVKNNRRNP